MPKEKQKRFSSTSFHTIKIAENFFGWRNQHCSHGETRFWKISFIKLSGTILQFELFRQQMHKRTSMTFHTNDLPNRQLMMEVLMETVNFVITEKFVLEHRGKTTFNSSFLKVSHYWDASLRQKDQQFNQSVHHKEKILIDTLMEKIKLVFTHTENSGFECWVESISFSNFFNLRTITILVQGRKSMFVFRLNTPLQVQSSWLTIWWKNSSLYLWRDETFEFPVILKPMALFHISETSDYSYKVFFEFSKKYSSTNKKTFEMKPRW